LDSRKQKFHVKIHKKLPQVWVDKDMLLRVLINLIENATKFSSAEDEITLSARAQDDWVTVSIHDNGPGIPAGDQDRIFDKFTRLRGSKRPGGLGVGLAFCRLAVEGHGGRIWVESEKESGTTFFFTLPVATQEQLDSA